VQFAQPQASCRGIIGVLLAGGASSRFGRCKLLASLPDGRPLVEPATRTLRAVLPLCIAVVRPQDQALGALLGSLGMGLVFNSRAEAGMGTSLALGVKTCPRAAGWVIALADMPCIQVATVRRVADALAQGALLAAPRHAGRRGHPVGFSVRLYDELAALNGDEGAAAILKRYPDSLQLLDVDDPGIHIDVDSPADLALGVLI
jgi:molybdenum cofactor cytidylyltransferase